MDENRNIQKKNRRWLYPLRAVAVLACFMLLRTLTGIRIYSLGLDDPSGMDLPTQVPHIFLLITNIFILNSISHLFCTYDHALAEKFRSGSSSRSLRFLKELKKILTSYEYIAETVVLIIGVTLFSLGGILTEGFACFYGSAEAPDLHKRLLPLIFFIPIVFFVNLFSHYEARRYWRHLLNLGNFKKLGDKLPLIFRSLAILILYPLVFPYAPMVVYMFVTVFAVLAMVAKVLTILGFVLFIALLFLLGIGISRLKFGSRKREFISSLSAIAEGEGRSIAILSKEEARERGYDLSYTDGEERYDVRIMYARRGVPLFFTKKDDAYFRHRIGTRNHHFTIERHFNYSFESEAKKALILIKFPKTVYVSSDGGSRRMAGGDKIWDTVVYDAVTFLGSADRGCLDRFNTGKW